MNLNHYQKLKQELHNTSLCIVSKRRTEEEILFYYQQGERIFGENRSEELILKANHLPKDIQWHYIGHLQRNKVRKLLPYLNTLESLDSLALADVLEKECQRIDKYLNVYLELHLAEEDEHKTGLLKNELNHFIHDFQYPHLNLCGLMVMGPHTDNHDRIKEVFLEAQEIFLSLKAQLGSSFKELSMGMSDDYPIALKCGSTIVRIGTYLFEGEEE